MAFKVRIKINSSHFNLASLVLAQNFGTLYYVEDQIELVDHYDYYRHSQNSTLYCENAYCDTFDSWTVQDLGYVDPALSGTRVDSISSEQCMDLCLCDEDCSFFVFATYQCYDGEIMNMLVNGQVPEQFYPCSMCRIFRNPYNMTFHGILGALTPFNPDYEVSSAWVEYASTTQVGSKSFAMIGSNTLSCLDGLQCMNPLSFNGTTALEAVGDGSCLSLLGSYYLKNRNILCRRFY